MTLLYVDNKYTVPMRSSYIIQTMNPRTFGDSGSGGSDKFNFMASAIALMDLAMPGCPLANLLKECTKSLANDIFTQHLQPHRHQLPSQTAWRM